MFFARASYLDVQNSDKIFCGIDCECSEVELIFVNEMNNKLKITY